MKALIRYSVCAALLAAAAPSAAEAGTLQVDPISVEISADRKTASIRVKNEDKAPVVVRAYALNWAQADGKDVYSETTALILSPPVATIAPGATQLIRVGLRSASSASTPYRIMIEEVPQARPGQGIQVALRLNLPLFVNMAQGSADTLRWSTFKEAGGSWAIEARNPSKDYVRIDPTEASKQTGLAQSPAVISGVILPGSSRRWSLGTAPAITDPAKFQRLAAENNAQPQNLAQKSR